MRQPVQQAGPVLIVNDSWLEVSKRSRKKHTEGKIEPSNLFKSQTSTTNQYTAFEWESITSNEEVNLETAPVNKTKTISTRKLGNKSQTDQETIILNGVRDQSNIGATGQHNLQVLTVVNGQISRKITKEMAHRNVRDQKRMVRSSKMTKAMANRIHKIFIIGDSHVKGLSEKVILSTMHSV
jgi:hypothetical protein